jgi:tRNA pseudouridine55 synthase
VNGILVVNKPQRLTSNACLQQVKSLLQAAKAGHTGSLDPLATGMLPLCFGEATKFSQYLLEADKVYQATAKLGIRTTTADAEGEIIERCPLNSDLTELQLLALLDEFQGDISQTPPLFCALKHQGQPFYKLARQGIKITPASRQVQIYQLDLLALRKDEFDFQVRCSKGTYIRSLVADMGDKLGCGAHVKALHRLAVGGFTKQQMVSLERLTEINREGGFTALDKLLLPVFSAVEHWPQLVFAAEQITKLQQGQPIQSSANPPSPWVQLIGPQQTFIGIGQFEQGWVKPKRLVTGPG